MNKNKWKGKKSKYPSGKCRKVVHILLLSRRRFHLVPRDVLWSYLFWLRTLTWLHTYIIHIYLQRNNVNGYSSTFTVNTYIFSCLGYEPRQIDGKYLNNAHWVENTHRRCGKFGLMFLFCFCFLLCFHFFHPIFHNVFYFILIPD